MTSFTPSTARLPYLISYTAEMSSTSGKQFPKAVEDIYLTTKADIELKLSETESSILAETAKSFEVVLSAVNETSTLVGDFVRTKSSSLESSLTHEKSSIVKLHKVANEIENLASKLSGMDRTTELCTFKKLMIDGLNQDVSCVHISFLYDSA